MTDRQQQKPLKKVQPLNTNPPEVIENMSFSLESVVKVNKEEIVQNVRVHISEEESRSLEGNAEDNEYENKKQEEEFQAEQNIEQQDKNEEDDGNIIDNQIEEEQESIKGNQNLDEQYSQHQASNHPQLLPFQQQQQVFSPTSEHKNQPQQNEPIVKKQINHIEPIIAIPQQYNKIKYTYNEMQDEEIALSSSDMIVSQHNVLGSENFVEKKSIVMVEEEKKSKIDLKEKAITSMEEMKSSESLEKKEEELVKQVEQTQLVEEREDQQNKPENHEQLQVKPQLQEQHISVELQNQQANLFNSKILSKEPQLAKEQKDQQTSQIPHSNNPTQQQQLSYSSQQQQSPSHFSLQRYKSIQPILEQLLTQLKSILKHVKSDTASQYLLGKNRPSNSKFFNGKNSRSESRNKYNKNGNNSLQDIMERRRQNLLFGGANSSNDKNHREDIKGANNMSYQQIGKEKDRVYVGIEGTKNKAVPYGLGNLGNVSQFDIMRHPQQDPTVSDDHSRLQDQQRQKLIINRQKINQILASSVSNFKKPEPIKNKFKSTSYFNHRNQPFHQQRKAQLQKNEDVSFVADSQSSHNQQQFPRKIIKSTNFSKLNNKHPQSIQEIPSSSTNKNTIQQQKQQKAFFLQKPSTSEQHPLPTSITSLLKIIKKYLQVIAQGKIDDIETFLNTTGEGLMAFNNLNELINRKKLFKTAMYFERASIVAGVCYGYLMITEQRGYLSYQMQQIAMINQSSKGEQVSKQSIQSLKQQIKQILKYMINLASFCLNNCKLITKTIQDHLIKPSPQSITSQQPSKTKTKQSSHQLIQKQIYKRNIQTIKLNIQYTQQTLSKLFSQTLGMAQKLAIDQDFGESFKNVTKLIQKHTIQESFYTLLEYFSFYLCLIKRQRSIPFLAVAPNPYLDTPEKYTLVIDFVSVFCYGTKKSKTFIFRPYSQHFLNQMAQYFDIVAMCDALPQQIDKIIDLLDTRGVIKHRLYKYHMVEEKVTGRYTKSLQRIGRDMDKVILLDVENNQVMDEAKNTIFISEWKGSKNDSVLAELCSVLLSIVVNRLDCTRAAERIHEQMKVNLANGIRHINFGLNLKEDLLRQSNNMKIVNEIEGQIEKE